MNQKWNVDIVGIPYRGGGSDRASAGRRRIADRQDGPRELSRPVGNRQDQAIGGRRRACVRRSRPTCRRLPRPASISRPGAAAYIDRRTDRTGLRIDLLHGIGLRVGDPDPDGPAAKASGSAPTRTVRTTCPDVGSTWATRCHRRSRPPTARLPHMPARPVRGPLGFGRSPADSGDRFATRNRMRSTPPKPTRHPRRSRPGRDQLRARDDAAVGRDEPDRVSRQRRERRRATAWSPVPMTPAATPVAITATAPPAASRPRQRRRSQPRDRRTGQRGLEPRSSGRRLSAALPLLSSTGVGCGRGCAAGNGGVLTGAPSPGSWARMARCSSRTWARAPLRAPFPGWRTAPGSRRAHPPADRNGRAPTSAVRATFRAADARQ